MTQKINNLQTLSNHYDVFLIDAWGVLHDGGKAFTDAVNCLQSLKKDGKTVAILSNAARRTNTFNQELLKSGIDNSCYDFSLSSGELVWQNLKLPKDTGLTNSYGISGNRCFYLGPTRSMGLLDDLDLELVIDIDNADFILNTGIEGNQTDASSHRALLLKAAQKQLAMICANPDLVAIRKGVLGISAGAIAKFYETLGGIVHYTGKPYSQIYDVCFDKLGETPKSRILMIGDGLQTDIKGADDSGIDSLFIKEGIYYHQIEQQKHESSEDNILNMLFTNEGAQPTYYMNHLCY